MFLTLTSMDMDGERNLFTGRKKSIWFRHLVAMILFLVPLSACSTPPPPAGPGDATRGKELFNKTQELAGAPTCSTCHVIEPGAPAIVGPNLNGIHLRAEERVPGMSAEEYIRTSILDPYAYIVKGYQSGIMVRTYGEHLSEQQVNDLVAYLMTL